MRVKELFSDKYQVVAVMDGVECPAENYLAEGEEETCSYRTGLTRMLETVSENGLQGVPAKWFHEANKEEKIFEFIKGPLRLFFFKGCGFQIAVCAFGVRKQSKKADQAEVAKVIKMRKEYFDAIACKTLEVIENEN